jgi:type VI secretion system protein VasD
MRNTKQLLWPIILITATLFLIGCPKEAARVNMALVADPNLNPDSSGQPLSVVVRIYQLKDKGRLETADYNSIWKSDRETLSEDFLDRQERIVQPDAQEILEIKAHPMAAYLGVVALFQNPVGDTWRKVIPISGKNQKIRLSLREQNIEIVSVGK